MYSLVSDLAPEPETAANEPLSALKPHVSLLSPHLFPLLSSLSNNAM